MRFVSRRSLPTARSIKKLNRRLRPRAESPSARKPPITEDTMTKATLESVAFLFPGQGSQAVGMGKELAALYPVAQETFDEADVALGYKLSQVCWEGPEEKLKLTEITQPAILTVS